MVGPHYGRRTHTQVQVDTTQHSATETRMEGERKGSGRNYSGALAIRPELNLLQLSHSSISVPRNHANRIRNPARKTHRHCNPTGSRFDSLRRHTESRRTGGEKARGGAETAMDAAPVLKRKGAEEAAPEPWVHVPATKIRRLVRTFPLPRSRRFPFLPPRSRWIV
jgi:hypothetical protein